MPASGLCSCGTVLPDLTARTAAPPAAAPVATPVPGPAAPDLAVVDLGAVLQKELGNEIAVEGELASGHTFAVFGGTEVRSRRKVAIKVISPQLATQNPTRVARVLRAARVAAALEHPHIVPVYRVAAGDRLAWFVTERLPDSLAQVLQREYQLPLELALAIAGQTADALILAHGRRVLHGDLTPAVIMLDEARTVKVRDFGIAPAADLKRPGLAPSYDPDYLAPERLSGAGAPSVRADQYALAVTLYQMLSGSLPFPASAAELLQVDRAALPVPDVRAERPDVPEAIALALTRALAPEPDNRFESVAAFVHALTGRPAKSAGPQRPTRPRPRTAPAAAVAATTATPRAPRIGAERPLVRPSRVPTGNRVQPATAFAVLTTGLVGLWLYIANVGARDSDVPEIRVPPADTWAPQQRTFAGATPPDDDTGAAPAESVTPRPAAPRREPARQVQRTPPRQAARTPAREAARTPAREPARSASRQADGIAPPAAPATAGIGYITVGSVPQGAIFINGRLTPSNPVVAYPVPVGSVRLRFEAPDANGATLEREMTVTIAPADTLNLGRVRLSP